MRAKSTVFVLVSLSMVCSCSQQPKKKKRDTAVTNSVQVDSTKHHLSPYAHSVQLVKGTHTAYDDFVKREKDSVYICSYKGKVEMTDTLRKSRHLLFDLKAEFLIDKIFVYEFSPDVFFVCWQETDHEGVRSYLALFKRGKDKPEWKRKYLVPDPAQPVIDTGYAYFSTLGMVGKLKISDGTVCWKLDSLFNPLNNSFQKFKPAVVSETSVLFIDFPVAGLRSKPDTLRLDAATGKRLH